MDDESDHLVNSSPKNPAVLLEAADGSDDDVDMLDPAPQLEDFEDDEDKEEEPRLSKVAETDDEQLGKLNILYNPEFNFPH